MEDLRRWTTWGLLALEAAMLGMAFFSLRWKGARVGIEISVMFMAALGIGASVSLFRQAVRYQSLAYEPFDAYANLGVMVVILQTIFWIAFFQRRAVHRASPLGDAA